MEVTRTKSVTSQRGGNTQMESVGPTSWTSGTKSAIQESSDPCCSSGTPESGSRRPIHISDRSSQGIVKRCQEASVIFSPVLDFQCQNRACLGVLRPGSTGQQDRRHCKDPRPTTRFPFFFFERGTPISVVLTRLWGFAWTRHVLHRFDNCTSWYRWLFTCTHVAAAEVLY